MNDYEFGDKIRNFLFSLNSATHISEYFQLNIDINDTKASQYCCKPSKLAIEIICFKNSTSWTSKESYKSL